MKIQGFKSLLLASFLLAVFCNGVNGTYCLKNPLLLDLECPGLGDPASHIFCCGPDGSKYCCNNAPEAILTSNPKLVIGIVCGTIGFVILMLIVCCCLCPCCCCYCQRTKEPGTYHSIVITGQPGTVASGRSQGAENSAYSAEV